MPADFTINTDQKVVFSIGWNTVTLVDIVNHRTRLAEDTRHCLDFRQIIDFTNVTEMELSNTEIWSLAKEPVFTPESRRALVAPSSLQFGLSRVFQSYSLAQNISVFGGLNQAVEWVGVPLEVANEAFIELRSKHGLT